jgi:hypothetical protein
MGMGTVSLQQRYEYGKLFLEEWFTHWIQAFQYIFLSQREECANKNSLFIKGANLQYSTVHTRRYTAPTPLHLSSR